jgi:hypothetical protein
MAVESPSSGRPTSDFGRRRVRREYHHEIEEYCPLVRGTYFLNAIMLLVPFPPGYPALIKKVLFINFYPL